MFEVQAARFAHTGWVVVDGVFGSGRMSELAELTKTLAEADLSSGKSAVVPLSPLNGARSTSPARPGQTLIHIPPPHTAVEKLSDGIGVGPTAAAQLLGEAVGGSTTALQRVQSVSGGTPRWYGGGAGGVAVSPVTFDPDFDAATGQTSHRREVVEPSPLPL